MPTAGTEAASGSLIFEGQAGLDYTLNQHPSDPTNGDHFSPARKDTQGGVAHERHTSPRPPIQFDLTDAIKIEFLRLIQLGEDTWTFPTPTAKPLAHDCPLRRQVECQLRIFGVGGEDKEEQRPIVMHRKAREHSSGVAVNDEYVLIARAIAASLERRDEMAEPFFEPVLRTERETSNGGMKLVGARTPSRTDVALHA